MTERSEADERKERKIVQIAACPETENVHAVLYALADDGSLWLSCRSGYSAGTWERFAGLPPIEVSDAHAAMRLQLDSACQYRDRYKAERDEARDKRFFWENACRRAEGVMVQEAQAKHEALWQLMEATGPVSRETMTEVAVAVARQMNDSHDPYDFKGIARAAITALGRSVEGP